MFKCKHVIVLVLLILELMDVPAPRVIGTSMHAKVVRKSIASNQVGFTVRNVGKLDVEG